METISSVITTVLELSAVMFVIWGYVNEDKFIAFEQGIARKVKRYIHEKD